MKISLMAAALPVALAVGAIGCTPVIKHPEAETAQRAPAPAPAKLSAQQELAKYCRVCVVDKGEKIEEFFPSRLDTKRGGQTYKFCTDGCKKKFDASPGRYALK